MDQFPNLKKHLDNFKDVITSSNKPYGLHRSRDENLFVGEKIISLRKTSKPHFTYTDFDCYVSQTFNIIKTTKINLKFLTGLLNSSLINFWLKHKGKKQGEMLQIDIEPLTELPILIPTDYSIFLSLIDQIITLKKSSNNSEVLEKELDQKIYDLYELSPNDINILEKSL